MAGSLLKQNKTNPISALGFFTYVMSIPNNDFYTFAPKNNYGQIVVSTLGTNYQGMAWYRSTSSAAIDSYHAGANTAFTTGALNGTTGSVGNLTVSSASGAIYVENRTGSTLEVTVTMLTY